MIDPIRRKLPWPIRRADAVAMLLALRRGQPNKPCQPSTFALLTIILMTKSSFDTGLRHPKPSFEAFSSHHSQSVAGV